MSETLILGGGVTGLAVGIASGAAVFEAKACPGGICSSYYRSNVAGPDERDVAAWRDNAYRFEIGGGHWIFGGDPSVLRFIEDLVPVSRYERKSAVWFAKEQLLVPYPIQNNLRFFSPGVAAAAVAEMKQGRASSSSTVQDWLRSSFGKTLCDLFFEPFHDLYTAGLYCSVAPQDTYKSPVDIRRVIRGATGGADEVGYNVSYIYPKEGLDALADRMAERCDVRYNKHVVHVDTRRKEVSFSDGTSQPYSRLISTLPLNQMLRVCDLSMDEEPDPYTSVLVLNIGALRGPNLPKEHWLYHDRTNSGFHRTGIYSNVDSSFLPSQSRASGDRASLYIERAFRGGDRQPADGDLRRYCGEVVSELQAWGFVDEVEVVDPTWIDVAYTWSWPGSTWREKALMRLQEEDVFMVGRYGRWTFQGIADSIRDGFVTGSSLRTGT